MKRMKHTHNRGLFENLVQFLSATYIAILKLNENLFSKELYIILWIKTASFEILLNFIAYTLAEILYFPNTKITHIDW